MIKIINGTKCKEHHTALFRGYVSRKNWKEEPVAYKGKFGSGYTIDSPNWSSTTYSYRTYYIAEED